MKTVWIKALVLAVLMIVSNGSCVMAGNDGYMKGVVYDVGLMFGGVNNSVETFSEKQVDYDMSVIAGILYCNTVRIEGEDIERLEKAARYAHSHGLKVFFNPWKHGASSQETIEYMGHAAKAAEKLRNEGVDLVFVAGCEYSLFSSGVFPGDTFDQRMQWLFGLGQERSKEAAQKLLSDSMVKLNDILCRIVSEVRAEYHGPVTYSSGTWEYVDWSIFDIIGIDYYRNGETEEEYRDGLNHYLEIGMPVVVMEVGCCAYEGAAERGSFGFGILQGTDSDGNPVWEGETAPVRNENVQAEYISDVTRILSHSGVAGQFIYLFRFPIYPYASSGLDMDMISYALVKSFPTDDEQNESIPNWRPKKAFFRLGEIYSEISERKD